MAVVMEEASALVTSVGARFNVENDAEGVAILADLVQTLRDRLEYHGFHPEGVTVWGEVR